MLQQTVKAKLLLTPQGAQSLQATMEEYNRACNALSELAYVRGITSRYDLHHAGYHLLRKESHLPAQHVVNALQKVSAAYVREPDKLHRFKEHSAMRFDARTLTLSAGLTVCPKGRVVGQLQMPGSFRRKLSDWQLGSAELVYRSGVFYLHISVSKEAPEIDPPAGSLGVDLGVNRTAVTSNRRFQAARVVRHQKACYKRTRRSLQANGSKSAKRALARVSGRERRFVSDVNHCVSKQIVAEAKTARERIVLEDLKGIRASGKAKCLHEWSFAELQEMIRYKAARAGVEVVSVDPRYTSQMCARCLHMGCRPTQSEFRCRNCGLQINADLNGARAIAARHDLAAMGRLFCAYPPKKVDRPEAVRSLQRASSTKSGTASPRLLAVG